MHQTYLNLDDPPVGAGCPATSHEAADSMRPHASRLAQVVLAFIRSRGGATCSEVEQGTGLAHQTASARVWELRRAGFIVDSSRRRKTPSGRSAIVWTAK